MYPIFFICLSLFLSVSCSAGQSGHSRVIEKNHKAPNVILITLDGVRPSEFFAGMGSEHGLPEDRSENFFFPGFWSQLSHSGQVYGFHPAESLFTIGSPQNLSLPSYHSLFLGQTSECLNNQCTYQGAGTLFDQLLQDGMLTERQIAAFTTWEPLKYALSARPASFPVSAGFSKIFSGESLSPVLTELRSENPEAYQKLVEIETAQNQDLPPWHHSRKDVYTWAMSINYLGYFKPKFLYIGLGDADELAHLGDRRGYLDTLLQYDRWLMELHQWIDSDPDYKNNTIIIVTTDHGRGYGSGWQHHGPHIPESNHSWMYLKHPSIEATGLVRQHPPMTQLMLRPYLARQFSLNGNPSFTN